MLSKNNRIVTALAFVGILMVPVIGFASVTVENISLKRQGDFTELTVYGSERMEYEHQIVEPGAGKPYRIVLDLKDAEHDLPHYNFNDLPGQSITSIRTSQFSVKPERIVRIVLDVRGKITYKVREGEGSVTLMLSTPDDKHYPFWCAQPLSEAEKIQLALSGSTDAAETVSDQAQEDPVSETEGEEPVLVSSTVWGEDEGPQIPGISNKNQRDSESSEEAYTQPATADNSNHKPIENKEPEKSEISNLADTGKLATAILSTPPSFEEMGDLEEDADAAPVVADAGNKATDGNGDREASQPSILKDKKPEAQNPPAVDTVDTKEKPAVESDVSAGEGPEGISDSGANEEKPILPREIREENGTDIDEELEYRKNPDRPTKTSGTLAGRFPKRKVVNYQSWGKRDPFTALIDKSLAGYEPGEPPNVETLRLVGVLESPQGSSALLEDVEGFGYILQDGDPIKNGYVVQIRSDKIIFQVQEYGWSRTIALKLESDEE